MSIKKEIKKIVPPSVWNHLHRTRGDIKYWVNNFKYNDIRHRILEKNSPIHVVFLPIDCAVWKFDSLYQLMQKDPLFKVSILVCPVVNRGREFMLKTQRECCVFFEKKGYPYLCAYDECNDSFIDISTLEPDIIFYTNPYKGLIDDRYYIDNISSALTCYVNYGYINVPFEWAVALPFHKKLWKYFVECEDNRKLVKSWSPLTSGNVCVSGYPMFEAFANSKGDLKDWKLQQKSLKRIIWAPHHSISNASGMVQFSTFELHYDTMLELARKYQDKVQFVFKPHPLLKSNLYKLDGWGRERTDAYYNEWAEGENTAFVNGEYVDLFVSSDAMIHDCASFMTEYLYTKHPVLFMANYDREGQSNECAKKAYHSHYHARTKEEIENFIVNVVIGGDDPMKAIREKFYDEVLLPPNGYTAAENMLNEIKKSLGK